MSDPPRVQDAVEAYTGSNLSGTEPLSVFSRLAEAQINLRHAERDRDLVVAQAEQEIIDGAPGGIKAIGPTQADQRRYFLVALKDDPDVILAEQDLVEAQDALDRAKAAVREYEFHWGGWPRQDPRP